ncbi:PH domain-containing protein [Phaeocystidibacter luteus]|uniref:PH domain-containing protein n=1 Tax=Phaeocystidibacter luteus TaxID=911197 RepID=A0A6N6RGC8_9FLAO|nr:PH domain-containing protein [Phaeocystidibacter luteus]KAB2810239.1 PH domain-containing protein [Phaeocystidibacter luteus]
MDSAIHNTEPKSDDIFSNVSVDPNQLPKLEEVEYQPISPKYKAMQLVVTLIVVVLIAVGGTATSLSLQEGQILSWSIMGGAMLLFFTLRTLLVNLGYKWKGYALREKDLIYRSGLIWRKVIIIPFARIQHGELSEGVIERFYGLKKIRVYTAGGSSSDLTIPGLPKERAEQLRKFIMDRVIEEAEEEAAEEVKGSPVDLN